jgi:hypothetical protein
MFIKSRIIEGNHYEELTLDLLLLRQGDKTTRNRIQALDRQSSNNFSTYDEVV